MKKLSFLIILLLCSFAAAAAERKADSLAFCNAEWTVTELGKGATAAYASVQMFDSQQSISVIKYPARRFKTRCVHTPGEYAGPTSATAIGQGAEMAINGGYFNMKELVPCVYFRIGKEVFSLTDSSEVFRVNGVVGFKDKRGRRIQIKSCLPDQYQEVTGKWHSVMATGPMLMSGYEILVPEFAKTDENGKGIDSFNDRRHPRTAMGYDRYGNICLIVIDGRHKSQGDGASIYETALICSFLGLTDAINLDGGGSSAIWSIETGVLNHPSDNKTFDHEGERVVPNIIGVF